MPETRLIDATRLHAQVFNDNGGDLSKAENVAQILLRIENAPTIDAQPVKHGHWSECYRDCRCISVICSVCKNATVISHGCLFADEVPMNYVIEKLPHCPKCCSDMRDDDVDS